MVKLWIHGRGNAWPIPLGETHPFYDRHNPRDLSNAAFSLLLEEGKSTLADVLVDDMVPSRVCFQGRTASLTASA
jgi:hypothetical protein